MVLGEDGPTHQPVEHAAMLRLTPDLSVWRPCDAVESTVAWKLALERDNQPTCLLFSRQNTAHQHRDAATVANIARGGYTLVGCAGTPDVILIATGSEVGLAVSAAEVLSEQGKRVRVVSMPSTDVFDAQNLAYRNEVLPPAVTQRVAIEAAAADYWYKYVGLNGKIIGLHRYGESAPASDIFKALGFTVNHVVDVVNELLSKKNCTASVC